MSVGMFMAFLAYRSQFDSRLSDLIGKYFDFKMLSLHAERLADVVLTAPEPAQALWLGEDRLSFKNRPITLENLRFRYSEQDPWVLQGINLEIEAGQSLAVVGG